MGFENISLFFAAIVWWEIGIFGVVMLLSIGFLWEERASIPFVAMVFVLFYHWGSHGAMIEVDSFFDIWVYLLMYITVGLVWSFFKWGRLVSKFVKLYSNEARIRSELKSFSNDTIAYWILWWPFSILGFVFDDAINWLISHFKGAYNMITDKILSSALDSNKITKDIDDTKNNDYFKNRYNNQDD